MSRRFSWPTDTRPVVEVGGEWRNAARDAALRVQWRRIEQRQWDGADSWQDLCELVAQFCEGKLHFTPDHGGGRCPETVPIAAELAHTNRQGFLTTCSQSGEDEEWGDGGERFQQRPAVEGYASPETVQKLRALIAGTRLEMQVAEKRPVWRTDFSNGVNVTRSLWPDGTQEWHTGFGVIPSQRAHFSDLGRPDLTEGAHVVTIYDPEYGDHRLLWERLGQPDWDNPTPPAETAVPEQSRPPEPPVGTVLETSDDIDTYRIERTDLGWHIQYREGENEFGERLTSFMGRGISWRAAWSAWGPPAGAAPFRPVAPDDPPLPPRPPEEPPPWAGMSPDAAAGEFDPPPPAQPWTPKGAAVNEAVAGAVQGVSQVTPTGLAAAAASAATGKDIKTPLASAAGASTASGATTASGGTGMSAVSEAKGLLAQSSQNVEAAQGALQQVISELQEAQQSFMAAMEESEQGSSDEAKGQLQQAITQAEELAQALGAVPQSMEGIHL